MENNETNNQEFHLRTNWKSIISITALIFVALSFQFFYHPKLVTPDGNFPVAPDIPKDMKEFPISPVYLQEISSTTEIFYRIDEIPDDLKKSFDVNKLPPELLNNIK